MADANPSDLSQHSSIIVEGFAKSGIKEVVSGSGRQEGFVPVEVTEQYDGDAGQHDDDLYSSPARASECEEHTSNGTSVNEPEQAREDGLSATERQNIFDFVRSMGWDTL